MPKRNITLPPIHNTRAPEQWRIISEHVDFEGKTVLDLGCGYGDLLWQAWAAGAQHLTGIDNSREIHDWLKETARQAGIKTGNVGENLLAVLSSVEIVTGLNWRADIIICFSVLPYLTDPTATLHWIREHSTQALIECQLAGDGPGFDWLKGPQDMRRWLDSIGWQSVERIGETVVEDRGTKRGIWLCQ